MFYIVECHIKCDEKAKEKLEGIIQQWTSVRLVINRRTVYRRETSPDEPSSEYTISGVLEDSELNKAYSLPSIVANNDAIFLNLSLRPKPNILESLFK